MTSGTATFTIVPDNTMTNDAVMPDAVTSTRYGLP